MRSGIFLTLCVIGYIAFIVWNVYKLKDISRNPQKYETVKGKERYKKSFWYESGYERYGKNYHATLLLVIPCMLLSLVIYFVVGNMIQRLLTPADALHLTSAGLWVGACGALFFFISFEQFIMFSVNRPIFVAARLYMASSQNYVKSWRNTILLLLVMGIICLPIMAIGIKAYSYADEEKIVTHGVFSLQENQIPYDTVISGETSYSYDKEDDTFEFEYTIVLKDGSELDISNFGLNGASYIDRMLQKYGVATAYGTVDADTYEQMKSICDENTMKFVDQCFTVNNR